MQSKLASILAIACSVSTGPLYAQPIFDPLLEETTKSVDPQLLTAKPSEETTKALLGLKAQLSASNMAAGIDPSGSDSQTDGAKAALEKLKSEGFAEPVSDQIIIRFAPDTSSQDIADVVADYSLTITNVYVGLGAVAAQTDLSQFFASADTPEERWKANIDVTNEFTSDERIIGATPNIAIEANNLQIGVMTTPLEPEVVSEVDFSSTETVDWGMADIGVVNLWGDDSLYSVRVGVIDVGFAPHEDIDFAVALSGPKDDHGNHVAGIACAKHNGIGIAGVIPKCQVVPMTGNFLPIPSEGDNVQSFLLLFSQILLSMDEFVTRRDEVIAFNASLGYNWQSNFGIDPSDPENEIVRANIQSQGIFMFPVLQDAAERDILVFSAAGNDSSEDDSRDALYASPFNWAARTACETSEICSGVIVEAHDRHGDRAAFSNINGDLSCPGVGIVSALAGSSSYAAMSGTSMASPYCMGGYAIFSMLRPQYSSARIRTCLLSYGEEQSHGTRRMDLNAALAGC